MRIAYILDCFPALTETFVLDEIDEITRQGAQVVVYSIRKPSEDSPHRLSAKWGNKTRYRPLNAKTRVSKLIEIIKLLAIRPRAAKALLWSREMDSDLRWKMISLWGIAREMLVDNIGHIHAHFANNAAECAWCLSKLTGIPFSVTTHRYDIIDAPYRYYSQLASDSAFIRTISRANITRLQALGVPEEKLYLIHCGVRIEDDKNDTSGLYFDIVSVGSLIKRKGHQVLIEAIYAAKKEGVHLSVGIIGGGPEKPSLEKLIANYQLDENVKLLGSQPHEKVRDIVRNSRLFVLPSFSEGISVAAMEAMANGTLVIASDIEGMRELIDPDKTGYLFPPGDAGVLARLLINHCHSNTENGGIARDAYNKIMADFNMEIEVDRLRLLIKRHCV